MSQEHNLLDVILILFLVVTLELMHSEFPSPPLIFAIYKCPVMGHFWKLLWKSHHLFSRS